MTPQSPRRFLIVEPSIFQPSLPSPSFLFLVAIGIIGLVFEVSFSWRRGALLLLNALEFFQGFLFRGFFFSFASSSICFCLSISFQPSPNFERFSLRGSSGCPLGPVFVGGPAGCLESQIMGGKMADVFITSETRVTLFPPVNEYSHRFLAPRVAFVFDIRAPFQSVPFMTRLVTGLQERTSWGLSFWWSPSWYHASVKSILDILDERTECHQLDGIKL
jgi:hypothetical protein